jgi:hypothetical protein
MSAGAVPSAEYLIETVIVGAGGAASVTFSNLAQYVGVYKHLKVVGSARTNRANTADVIYLDFNGAAGTIGHYMLGDGSSVSSDDSDSRAAFITGGNAATGAFGALSLELHDAFNASKNKTIRSLSGPGLGIYMQGSLWASTSTLTSLTFRPIGSFVQYSRLSLYGVTA